MTSFTPREIVSELDRYIVGQNDAKRAVADRAAQPLAPAAAGGRLREEVLPKNILMIGPTGVGKTEIARRLAKLAQAPFLKVEATKFTEVGYVGRDVEQIIRDLVEIAIDMTREKLRKQCARGEGRAGAEERVLTALVGDHASADTREKFRRMLRSGELDERESRSRSQDGAGLQPDLRHPGHARRADGHAQPQGDVSKAFGGRRRSEADDGRELARVLVAEEADKLLDRSGWSARRSSAVEKNGIVFLDEIDKITARAERRRRRQPRGRAARPAAADRGHDGADQARPGEDRPHPVHRVRRLPHRQAVRPAAGAAGPPADPRRAEGADPRRLRAHPDRARGEPDQAVQGAGALRRGDLDIRRRCPHPRRRTGEERRPHQVHSIACLWSDAVCRAMAIDIKIVLEPSEDGGSSVWAPSLPGCISKARSAMKPSIISVRPSSCILSLVEDDAMLPAGAEVTGTTIRPSCQALPTKEHVAERFSATPVVVRQRVAPRGDPAQRRTRFFRSSSPGRERRPTARRSSP